VVNETSFLCSSARVSSMMSEIVLLTSAHSFCRGAAELADVLIGSLQLDFAFVRLCDPHRVSGHRGDAAPDCRGFDDSAAHAGQSPRLRHEGFAQPQRIFDPLSGIHPGTRGKVTIELAADPIRKIKSDSPADVAGTAQSLGIDSARRVD